MSETDTIVSHEQDGRILTGVGVDADSLAETMERHAPEPEAPVPPPPAADTSASTRNDKGQFAKVDGEPERKTRGQKRFDELTGEREAERRRAETAEQERDRLRAELDQLRARPAEGERRLPPSPPAVSEAAPAKKAPETRVKPTEDQIGVKYQSYADFVEDLADWKSEQRLAQIDFDARIRQSIEADRATRTVQDTIASAADRGRKTYPDFDAVLTKPVAQYPHDFLARIAKMDGAEHIYYRLATDREVSQRIHSALNDPLALGMELAKVASAAVASPASTARTMGPPPPPPYQPVGGGSKTTVPSSADLASGHDFDKSGYRERRAAERGVNRR